MAFSSRTPQHQQPLQQLVSCTSPKALHHAKPGTPGSRTRQHAYNFIVVMLYMGAGWMGVDVCLSRLTKIRPSADVTKMELKLPASQRSGASPALATSAEQLAALRRERLLKCAVDDGFFEGEWVNSSWVKEPLYSLPADSPFRVESAEGTSVEGESGLIPPHDRWAWEPRLEECQLIEFDRGQACQLLRGPMNVSRILFVGDAMTYEHALSFVGMLGGSLEQQQSQWTETKVCEEALGAEGGIAVQYIWNDALYTSPKRLEGPPAGQGAKEQWSDVDFEHSQPWTRYLLQKQPGLVVLNLGTRIHEYELYTRVVDGVVSHLRDHTPVGTKLVFRTTSPGHQDCWNFSSPTVDLAFNREFSGEYRDTLKWHVVADNNAYAAAQFVGQLKAMILHGDKLSRFRPDAHVGREAQDGCLQWLLPGVPDWWTKVMLNMFEATWGQDEEKPDEAVPSP